MEIAIWILIGMLWLIMSSIFAIAFNKDDEPSIDILLRWVFSLLFAPILFGMLIGAILRNKFIY